MATAEHVASHAAAAKRARNRIGADREKASLLILVSSLVRDRPGDQATADRYCSTKGESAICRFGNRVGKSGGEEDVPAAYCAHQDAAGFASSKAGNQQTETIGCHRITRKSWAGGSPNFGETPGIRRSSTSSPPRTYWCTTRCMSRRKGAPRLRIS